MCKLKKVRPALENQNELDKIAGESSPEGMSWDEYEKANYTPEEIAASDKRVAKMCKKIERKQRRRGL